MYYKITIDETGRNSLREEPRRFNTETIHVATIEEARKAISDRYGKIPKRRDHNTVFQDNKTDGMTHAVGFLRSYWNRDISHLPCTPWYQTDWVTVTEVNETPVLVN